MTVEELRNAVSKTKTRSAWAEGVKIYALELVENLGNAGFETVPEGKELKKALLNGADDWGRYSWGGCSLICDADICARLCNNTEKKIVGYEEYKGSEGCTYRNVKRDPNKSERWLDTQARALFQAERLINSVV